MPRIAFYYQDCPTCGRTLLIRVEYLGRQLSCQHCRGRLTALDPHATPPLTGKSHANLLDRANRLLETVHASSHGKWN